MKGKITHYIEIPITVHYRAYKAERQTMEYPGCPAHIEVEEIIYPTQEEIDELIKEKDRLGVSEENRIEDACWEDVGEREYPN